MPKRGDKKIYVTEFMNRGTKETEWAEFKHNIAEDDEIGEYLSALSNSAALCGKASAYLIWGMDNVTHDIIGTTFQPSVFKVDNEELEKAYAIKKTS